MIQKITIIIDTKDKPAYELVEKKGDQEYEALLHFFKDINIEVKELTIEKVDV